MSLYQSTPIPRHSLPLLQKTVVNPRGNIPRIGGYKVVSININNLSIRISELACPQQNIDASQSGIWIDSQIDKDGQTDGHDRQNKIPHHSK